MSRAARVDATLVAGGKYHDIDFARLELLRRGIRWAFGELGA